MDTATEEPTMGRYDEYKRRVLEVSQALSEQGYFGTKSGSAGNVSALVEGEEAGLLFKKVYIDVTRFGCNEPGLRPPSVPENTS